MRFFLIFFALHHSIQAIQPQDLLNRKKKKKKKKLLSKLAQLCFSCKLQKN